jgi:hypothetical protein
LIVVNADVTVAYDLHLMKYDIDEKTKQYRLFIFQRLKLTDIKFYDVEQSKLNPLREMITTKLMRLLKLV